MSNAAQSNPGRGVNALFAAACLVVVIAGLKAASSMLLPVLVSLFLAIITLPLVLRLQHWRLPPAAAVPLSVFIVLVVLGVMLVVVSGSATRFIENYNHGDYKEPLNERRHEVLEIIPPTVNKWLIEKDIDLEQFRFSDLGAGFFLQYTTSALSGLTSVLGNSLTVVLIMIFVLFEAAVFPRKLQLALGEEHIDSGRVRGIVQEVQAYFGLKTLTSLATGALVTLWLWLCGVEFPVLWGLAAFILNFVPNIGSFMAAVPAVLMAMLLNGFGNAAMVIAGYVVINVGIGNFVEPRVMGKRLGLSTLVVFLSLIFWGWVWGPIGMLLSVPLTMFVKILLENTPDLRWLAVLLSDDSSVESLPQKTAG